MIEILRAEIERKARSILRSHRSQQNLSAKYAKRFTKRTGTPGGVAKLRPPTQWALDKHFDPLYCISHASSLAKSLWRKIQDGSYVPKPAVKFEIPKPDGGVREIMAFTIPDAAIANVFHKRLTERNIGLFSSYSFAYRPDKSIFDAVIHLQRALHPPKCYIVQYDYKKYFDSIAHDYLNRIINNNDRFIITAAERHVIGSFLTHPYATPSDYAARVFKARTEGVPQGSSLSLFLSNVAAHELDIRLERQNGMFVRFADDVVAVAYSYSDARNVVRELRGHCARAGLEINYEKSPGIRLMEGRPSDDNRQFFIDDDDGGDLKCVQYLDYLGHRISASHTTLTAKAVKRIKRKISEVIYIHLLQQPRSHGRLSPTRVGGPSVDWDLVTCLNEIRKYIYGGLSAKVVNRFLEDNIKLPYVRGLMSFYPLVNKCQVLAQLDGWLLSVLTRAIRERNRQLVKMGLPSYVISRQSLISGDWYKELTVQNETTLPSFVCGWRAARKFYKRYGLSELTPPSYYSLLAMY